MYYHAILLDLASNAKTGTGTASPNTAVCMEITCYRCNDAA